MQQPNQPQVTNEPTTNDLKARAYDAMAQIEAWQKILTQTNQQIQQKQQQEQQARVQQQQQQHQGPANQMRSIPAIPNGVQQEYVEPQPPYSN